MLVLVVVERAVIPELTFLHTLGSDLLYFGSPPPVTVTVTAGTAYLLEQ